MGAKGRPFYRVVVARSTASRQGSFVEAIGVYDPIKQPKVIEINSERALYWLLNGARPTDTTAYLLHKLGILDEFFKQRPSAKDKFKSLDKRTAAMSKKTAIDQARAARAAEPADSEPESSEAATEAVTEGASEAPANSGPEPEASSAEAQAEAAESEPQPSTASEDGTQQE
jgi:small subunit ribosomal protein S16